MYFRKEITEKQKLLNNSKYEAAPDKLAMTIHKINEALEEFTNANIELEKEEYKLGYVNEYKSNVNKAHVSLIVNLFYFFHLHNMLLIK